MEIRCGHLDRIPAQEMRHGRLVTALVEIGIQAAGDPVRIRDQIERDLKLQAPGRALPDVERFLGQGGAAQDAGHAGSVKMRTLRPGATLRSQADPDAVRLEIVIKRAAGFLDEEFDATVLPHGTVVFGRDSTGIVLLHIKTDQQRASVVGDGETDFRPVRILRRPADRIHGRPGEGIHLLESFQVGYIQRFTHSPVFRQVTNIVICPKNSTYFSYICQN